MPFVESGESLAKRNSPLAPKGKSRAKSTNLSQRVCLWKLSTSSVRYPSYSFLSDGKAIRQFNGITTPRAIRGVDMSLK
ncbi:MAG: hypothetical protein LBJ67_11390 [Planctomycetaceae bacterium]|nr:hypothetical protein [Planctomycetaceae bacterium]